MAFHGGGGVDGGPDMLVPFCEELAAGDQGLTLILAEYRTLNRNRATLDQMLKDASNALRWSQRRTPPGSRLFVMGASFGGLLALDSVLSNPKRVNGLILLNPVTDIDQGGFTNRVIPAYGLPHLSPMLRWNGWKGMEDLRCLTVHGDADGVVPIKTSERFDALWPDGHSQFLAYPNAGHGFFNLPAHRQGVAKHILSFISQED